MPKPTTKGPVGVLLTSCALALLLTVLAAWAAGTVFWFPEQASTVAAQVDFLFNIITWISIFFFVLITILMVWFAVKYRMRDPRQKATSDVTHDTTLELTWTIIPLILVIGIFYAGMEGYINLRKAPLGAYEVRVTAMRWSWSFTHPNGCSESVLRVPVNRPVRLLMESSDVLHALFIPAFRVKQDIVPGRITDLWFTATKEGPYDLFCAEYCGKDHSRMYSRVEVMSEEKLAASLQECADWAKNTADEELYVVAMEKIYSRCSSCHSLDGKDGTGPTWTGLWDAERNTFRDRVFTDGTTLSDLIGPGNLFETPEEYINQSILNPQQKIVMNFTPAMPTFKGQLKDRELRGLREAMKRLDEFDDKGKPKPGSPAAAIAEAIKARPAAPQ